MFRTVTPRQRALDLTLAALCLVLRLALGADAVMTLVVIAMAAGLALHRWSPALALIAVWAGALLQMGSGQDPDVSNLAVLPVLFATAAYGPPRVKSAGLVSAGVGALLATLYLGVYPFYRNTIRRSFAMDPVFDVPQFLLYLSFILGALLAAFGLSWTLGLLARTRRLARESRVAQRRAQEQTIVEQERNRIARDMHDVVAHSLAVVIAQADGARYARAGDPAAVDGALTTISATAREALGDVRLLLGQLRHNQGEGPQPALADLGRLLDQMRTTGLTIVRVEEGVPVSLGTGQQLAVYRIVQEALTNALRHGDARGDVTVRLAWHPSELEVTIVSALREQDPPPEGALGHGIAGMRERAVLCGGRFSAGRRDNRFVVTVSVPTASSRVGEYA